MWAWNEIMYIRNVAWCCTKRKSSIYVRSCSHHPVNIDKATKKMPGASHHWGKVWRADGWTRVGRFFSVPFPKLRVNGTHELKPVLRLYVSLPGVVIIYLSLLAKASFKANYSATPCSADPALSSHQVQTGWFDGFVWKVYLHLCLSPLICLSLSMSACLSVCLFSSFSQLPLFPLGGLMNIVWACVLGYLSCLMCEISLSACGDHIRLVKIKPSSKMEKWYPSYSLLQQLICFEILLLFFLLNGTK